MRAHILGFYHQEPHQVLTVNMKKNPLTPGKGREKVTILEYNLYRARTVLPALVRHLKRDGAPWEEDVAPAPRAVQPAGEDLDQHGEGREAFLEEVPKSVFKALAGMLEEEGKDDTGRMSRNNTRCVCSGR